MRNNYSQYILKAFGIISVSVFVFMASCKKDEPEPCPCYDFTNPACINFDPCSIVSPVTASFDILSQISVSPQFRDSFTLVNEVSGGGLIKFAAKEKNARKYTWYIGAETITGVSEISRVFQQPNVPVGSVIPITLIVEKDPDTLCFPDDDGIDTISRTFTIVSACSSGVNGNFRGVWEDGNNLDSFDIRFQFVASGSFDCSNLYAWGLDGTLSCDSVYCATTAVNSSFIQFSVGQSCGYPYTADTYGEVRYDAFTKLVQIDYRHEYKDPNTQEYLTVYRKFIGTKIN